MSFPPEIATRVLQRYELPSLDYKASMSWSDPATKSKVVKGAMAMANHRDGGLIVFGVRDGDFEPVGMPDGDFASFDNDGVAAEVNAHADPNVDLHVYKDLIDEMKFVVIEVSPFREEPIVCARNGGPLGELYFAGEVYIRPFGKPETRTVQSAAEMRDLIQRAVDVEMVRMRQRAPEAFAPKVPARAALDEEIGGFR